MCVILQAASSSCSPNTKKVFKMPWKKAKNLPELASGNSHFYSNSPPLPSSPASSSPSKAKRFVPGNGGNSLLDSPMEEVVPGDDLASGSAELKVSRRLGSLLELHGKLGVLLRTLLSEA